MEISNTSSEINRLSLNNTCFIRKQLKEYTLMTYGVRFNRSSQNNPADVLTAYPTMDHDHFRNDFRYRKRMVLFTFYHMVLLWNCFLWCFKLTDLSKIKEKHFFIFLKTKII